MVWLILFFLYTTTTYSMQEMGVPKQKNNTIVYPNWRNTITTISSCTQKALIILLPIAYASNGTHNSTEYIQSTPDLVAHLVPWIPACIGAFGAVLSYTYIKNKNKNICPSNVSTLLSKPTPLVNIHTALQNLSGMQDPQDIYQFGVRYAKGFPRIWANQEAISSKTVSLCLQKQFPNLPKEVAQHIFYFINTIDHEMNWYFAFGTFVPYAERNGKNPFTFIDPSPFYWTSTDNKTIKDQNLVAIYIQ
ncbi:MAG TPA: hypothetical protein VGW78_06370 [Candidatus Babeliales bacterium]|jgi:hypothetical protein|nr:hypothetical protein [Candidatus Babeliales bacterium]